MRLAVFDQESTAVLDYYRQNGKLIEIDGEKSIEEIFEEKYSFLEFLKWFASNYWGFLLILAALIILTFLFKSIKYNTI